MTQAETDGLLDGNAFEEHVDITASVITVWRAWTDSKLLAKWLANAADVEPKKGGRYELFWDVVSRDINSTLGCHILEIKHGQRLVFEWKGPEEFAPFMNIEQHLTKVFVMVTRATGGKTHIALTHEGWGEGQHWQNAMNWHKAAWAKALQNLKTELETNSKP